MSIAGQLIQGDWRDIFVWPGSVLPELFGCCGKQEFLVFSMDSDVSFPPHD